MLKEFEMTLGELADCYGVDLNNEGLKGYEDAVVEIQRDIEGWHISSKGLDLRDEDWAPRDDRVAMVLTGDVADLPSYETELVEPPTPVVLRWQARAREAESALKVLSVEIAELKYNHEIDLAYFEELEERHEKLKVRYEKLLAARVERERDEKEETNV